MFCKFESKYWVEVDCGNFVTDANVCECSNCANCGNPCPSYTDPKHFNCPNAVMLGNGFEKAIGSLINKIKANPDHFYVRYAKRAETMDFVPEAFKEFIVEIVRQEANILNVQLPAWDILDTLFDLTTVLYPAFWGEDKSNLSKAYEICEEIDNEARQGDYDFMVVKYEEPEWYLL